MSIGSADIAKAVNSLWDSSGLTALFTTYWTADERAQFDALNDTMAAPQNAFPYCVFEVEPAATTSRMSGRGDVKREIHDVPLTFRVFAKTVGDSRTSKEVAAALIEEISKVFGGHPSTAPTDMVLDNGNFLIAQYQTDYGVRVEEEVWSWVISYLLRVDAPVAVGEDISESSSWSSLSSTTSLSSLSV
jgi:hypothetical protein